MTVNISKPTINIREKLSELDFAKVPFQKMPSGSILQVVSTTKTDTFTTSSSSFTDVTGLSVSITPTSTSSKILLVLSLTAAGQNGISGAGYRLMRDSTEIGVGDSEGSRLQITGMIPYISNTNNNQTISGSFLDSPSTTSATTYKVQVGKSLNVYVNRTEANTDGANIYQARSVSTLTAFEIAG